MTSHWQIFRSSGKLKFHGFFIKSRVHTHTPAPPVHPIPKAPHNESCVIQIPIFEKGSYMCITFSCPKSSVWSSKIVWLTSMVSDPCLWWGRGSSGTLFTLLFLSGNAMKLTDVSGGRGWGCRKGRSMR